MSLPDIVVLALRAAAYVTALQAAGAPFFTWLFGAELETARPAVRRHARVVVAGAIVASIAYELLEPARMAGAFSGIWDRFLQGMLLGSGAGAATALRLCGLALIAVGVAEQSRLRVLVAVVGSSVVVAAFAFTGHTVTHDPRWLLVPALLAHLLIVAFWFGSLWPLWIAAGCETMRSNASLLASYSAVAIWLVPGIFVAGLVLAVALLPSLASLATPYGVLVLVKVAGFALLMGLAALNKWRLTAQIRAGNLRAIGHLRRSLLVEWGLIAAVVTVTALMTGLFSPGP